jgi:hypothetical protein
MVVSYPWSCRKAAKSFARPVLWRVALVLLILVLLVGAAVALHAATSPLPPSVRSTDWRHPMRVPGPDMARSGIGTDAGEVFTSLRGSNAAASMPQAGFPACYQGFAYRVGHAGVYSWSRAANGVESWAEYLWCPRWAGDAIGLNFSHWRSYVLSGCQVMALANDNDWGTVDALLAFSFTRPAVVDGEMLSTTTICAGRHLFDYSLTLRGDGYYSVGMDALDQSTFTHLFVWSPMM